MKRIFTGNRLRIFCHTALIDVRLIFTSELFFCGKRRLIFSQNFVNVDGANPGNVNQFNYRGVQTCLLQGMFFLKKSRGGVSLRGMFFF